MALAFVLVLGGLLAVYMGLNNVSFKGILSDVQSPISNPTSGGSSGATATPTSYGIPRANASGYGSYFSTPYTVGRTDQGVDIGLHPGDPIHAPGPVQIKGIIPNWFKGQPFVWFQFLSGPQQGKYGYVAEQITNIPPVGTILQQGQNIGTFANSGTNLELGWATSSGQTLAMATTGYHEGDVTPAGVAFRQFLHSLGI